MRYAGGIRYVICSTSGRQTLIPIMLTNFGCTLTEIAGEGTAADRKQVVRRHHRLLTATVPLRLPFLTFMDGPQTPQNEPITNISQGPSPKHSARMHHGAYRFYHGLPQTNATC